jgi:hypothetical protein
MIGRWTSGRSRCSRARGSRGRHDRRSSPLIDPRARKSLCRGEGIEGLQERCRWFNHLIRPPQKECGRDEYAEHPATERPAEYRRDSLATDHATMHELEGDWFTVLTRS